MIKQPDPKLHLFISLIKSGIRIISCVLGLIYKNITFVCIGLILAESLGILEELK